MNRSGSKKILMIIGIILIVLLISITVYLIVSRLHVELRLIGNSPLQVSYNSDYKDKGFTFTRSNKEINSEDYAVEVSNNVNTKELGNYTVVYKVKYRGKNYEITRNIEVVDNTPPEIITNIDTVTKDYCTKKEKTKLEASAIDDFDGDVTNLIEIEEKEKSILIKVQDSNGNVSEKEILVSYTEKPKNVLKLNGKSSIKITKGSVYEEQGATYQDGCGNILDKNVTITGEVNTEINGDYKITYTYAKTKETISRTVTVYTPSPKVIYLTFDDGPGGYTERILNTLDKYGVKATFFVTHQFPRYEYLIGREAEAGHTVAVHTYTHKYDVYSSYDAYLNDFNLMNSVIEQYTGEKSKLFRFPGGSSNTVSRGYAVGVVTEIANKMTEQGYVYFDWNVSSGDTGGATKEQVYENVVNGISRCSQCVVLMHDIKLSTVNALDDILNTLTSRGYTLAPLTIDSPTAHQKINN